MSEPSITPINSETSGPRVGEWVTVWGQVVASKTHPEDTCVEFFSHNEQWRGHVRLDRVERPGRPTFALPCSALYLDKKGRYIRCESHDGHGGSHAIEGHEWDRPDGWIEDNT